MNESSVFSEADLKPFQQRLRELREIVRRGIEKGEPEAMTKLLERQLSECGMSHQLSLFFSFLFSTGVDSMFHSLQESLAILDVELVPLYEKLVSLRRQLVALAAKPEKSKTELKQLKEELRKIDSLRMSFYFFD